MGRGKSVRTGVDIRRLANAVSSPGIDPRQWLVKAIVTDIAFDPAHGIFADVKLIPDGEPETVLVGTRYAGDDFGEYCPIKIDDTVLIGYPNGDPGEGGVIISRLWSGSEKPPVELSAGDLGEDGGDVTSDPTLRIENGATMRVVGKEGANYKVELDGNATFEISATGGSKVIIAAAGSVEITSETTLRAAGKTTATLHSDTRIKLGDSAALGVARLTDSVTAAGAPPVPTPPGTPLVQMLAWSSAVTTALGTLTAGSFVAVLDPGIGAISSASKKASSE